MPINTYCLGKLKQGAVHYERNSCELRHTLESVSEEDIQYIITAVIANICFWKHALEVLVGVVLVDVHLYLDLQHVLHHEVQYCYVFSYSCTFIVQNIWFGTLRTKHYFDQWELRLLSSFSLQWDESFQNGTRVVIRSPGSWAPLRKFCLKS